MREYFILRHGETEATVEGRHQCRIDTPLTQIGRIQAFNLGRDIKKIDTNIDGYYCSTMKRCRDSLHLLMNGLGKDSHVIYSDLLLEHDMGDFDGLTEAEVEQISPGFTQMRASDRWGVAPPGGENYMMVLHRVNQFMDSIPNTKRCVLVMGHKAFNKILIGTIKGFDSEQMYRIPSDCGGGWYINKNRTMYQL